MSSQVEKHKPNIEGTLEESRMKIQEDIAYIYKQSHEKLRELWSQLLTCLEGRVNEMEGCKEQWLCFSFELEQIMSDLADGEMEFSKSKNKIHIDSQAIKQEIERNKVFIFILLICKKT